MLWRCTRTEFTMIFSLSIFELLSCIPQLELFFFQAQFGHAGAKKNVITTKNAHRQSPGPVLVIRFAAVLLCAKSQHFSGYERGVKGRHSLTRRNPAAWTAQKNVLVLFGLFSLFPGLASASAPTCTK